MDALNVYLTVYSQLHIIVVLTVTNVYIHILCTLAVTSN